MIDLPILMFIHDEICLADLRFSNHIGSMLTYSAVDCGFEPWSGHTKNCRIGI